MRTDFRFSMVHFRLIWYKIRFSDSVPNIHSKHAKHSSESYASSGDGDDSKEGDGDDELKLT